MDGALDSASERRRTVVVAVRVTPAEAAVLDVLRGSLTRGAFIRKLLVDARRTGL